MPAGFAFVYMRDYRDAEDAIRGLDRYASHLVCICVSCDVDIQHCVSINLGFRRSAEKPAIPTSMELT